MAWTGGLGSKSFVDQVPVVHDGRASALSWVSSHSPQWGWACQGLDVPGWRRVEPRPHVVGVDVGVAVDGAVLRFESSVGDGAVGAVVSHFSGDGGGVWLKGFHLKNS